MEKRGSPAHPKVVSIRKEGGHQVTQLQLETLIYAKRKLREARKEYDRIRNEIEQEIISGAEIEFGVHVASARVRSRLVVV